MTFAYHILVWVIVVLYILRFALSSTPSSQYFSREPEDRPVVEFDPVTLECDSSGKSNILTHWTLDRETVPNDTRRYQIGTNLYIARVARQHDIGQFRCVVTNISSGEFVESRSAQLDILWIDVPEVVYAGPSASPEIGQELILTCKTQGNPDIQYKWYRNGGYLYLDERISYRSNRLHVGSLSTSDNGAYSCAAENRAGRTDSFKSYSLILSDGLSPEIEEVPKNVMLAPNSTAWFDCLYKNHSYSEWYHNNDEDPLTNSSRYIIFANGSLEIPFVSAEDAGFFKCRATVTNAEGDISITEYAALLKLAYLDDFSNNKYEPVFLEVGNNYEEYCSPPEGAPPPRMWWENPQGFVISDTGRIRVDDMRLVITTAQKTDSGLYGCIAANTYGQYKKLLNLTVGELLKFTPSPSNRNLELGSSARIYCKAKGDPPPEVKWIKENGSDEEWPPHIRDDNGTLHFNGVLSEDTGKYTCTASNSQGIISSTIDVNVTVSPKFTVTPNQTEVKEGGSVVLHCLAEGDPQPTIHWDKNNLLNGFDQERFTVLKNGSLYVSEAKLEDQGRYGCIAGNSGGFVRLEVNLIVKGNNISINDSESDVGNTMSIAIGAAVGYMVFAIIIVATFKYFRKKRKAAAASVSQQVPAEGGDEGDAGDAKVEEEVELEEVNPDTVSEQSKNSGNGANAKKTSTEYLSYPSDNIETLRVLGKGIFGDVILGNAIGIGKENEQTLVIIKILQKKNAADEFKSEIEKFSGVKHDNVVTLLAAELNEKKPYMIIEYSDWGDLKQFLIHTASEKTEQSPLLNSIPSPNVLDICHQIAQGMEYLAGKNAVHKDLATRNCMISSDMNVKIGCLGLCYGVYSAEYFKYDGRVIPLRWAAPEAVLENKWSTFSDVWSYAVLVWEVYKKGSLPFDDKSDEEVLDSLKINQLKWCAPEEASICLITLLDRCWNSDAADRPPFSEIAPLLGDLVVFTKKS